MFSQLFYWFLYLSLQFESWNFFLNVRAQSNYKRTTTWNLSDSFAFETEYWIGMDARIIIANTKFPMLVITPSPQKTFTVNSST